MGRLLKDNGKMGDDMDWVLKRVVDGYIVVNGRADRKDDMASDKVQHLRQNMREHGLVASKTDMAPKPMLMVVSLFRVTF